MKYIVVFFLTVTFLTGCESPNLKSRTYVTQGYNIASMKRFTWDRELGLSTVGVLFGVESKNLELLLRRNTLDAMRDRGYQYVERSENAQFMVSFVAGAMEQRQETFQSNRMDLDSSYSWTQTNEFLQGGISVVLKDPAEGEIIWQGTATQRIKNHQMRKQDGSVVLGLLKIIMETLPRAEP